MNYGYLREQYPAVISKDQLYRICHISKRKALWLLEHGVKTLASRPAAFGYSWRM